MVGTEATHSRSPPPPECSPVRCSAARRAQNGPHRRPHLQSLNGTKRPAASSPQGCLAAHRALLPGLGSRPRPPPPRSHREERRARRAPRRRLTAPRQPARPPPPSPPRRRLKATAHPAPRAPSKWLQRSPNSTTVGTGIASTGQGSPRLHALTASTCSMRVADEPGASKGNSPRAALKELELQSLTLSCGCQLRDLRTTPQS